MSNRDSLPLLNPHDFYQKLPIIEEQGTKISIIMSIYCMITAIISYFVASITTPVASIPISVTALIILTFAVNNYQHTALYRIMILTSHGIFSGMLIHSLNHLINYWTAQYPQFHHIVNYLSFAIIGSLITASLINIHIGQQQKLRIIKILPLAITYSIGFFLLMILNPFDTLSSAYGMTETITALTYLTSTCLIAWKYHWFLGAEEIDYVKNKAQTNTKWDLGIQVNIKPILLIQTIIGVGD